ncbi:DUF6284 family protein [Streptomyces sp. NPDC015171]|uniref:DUF6284 family protein n=1 Tax=Streptomyces sp. NPDC015171 TaxID=3364945 RepID=UPI0036FC31DD
MKPIVTLQAVVTADDSVREPTPAELDAVAEEMPLVLAQVELLDVEISLLDRPVTDWDMRRLRRARRKVLAARRILANRAAATAPGVA